MFSYLRPHRRTPSNPTSPVPDQTHSWDPPLHNTTDSAYHSGSRVQDVNVPQQRPPRAPSPPPFLPPINRITSRYDQPAASPHGNSSHNDELRSQELRPQANPKAPAPDSQQWPQRQRPESAGSTGLGRPTGVQYHRPQTGVDTVQSLNERSGGERLPFVTAADLQPSVLPPGRRPAGTRMPTPPQLSQTNVSTFEPTQPRSSRTRLNLLNPMSLLARRRAAQSSQYPTVTHTASSLTDPKPLDGFDPRIRGTKVHDFSAPRPKRDVSYSDVQSLRDANLGLTKYQRAPNIQQSDSSKRHVDEREPNRWSGGNYTAAFTEDFDDEQYPAAGPNVRRANDFTDLQSPKPPYARKVASSLNQTSSTTVNDSEAPQSTQAKSESGLRTISPNASPAILPDTTYEPSTEPSPDPVEMKSSPDDGIQSPEKSSSTKRRPRNVSQVSAKDLATAHLPKHMKSTSSRFSFDMIGAASQEKLLEDRHRQRAVEKKSSSPEPQDEYSNYGEDDFDYDNMYDDDGLEERIPGVNADMDDADNVDTDKFNGVVEPSLGGFTFHSMAASASTSPLSSRSPVTVNTPRDANGDVIGFAITKESPSIPTHQVSQSTVPLQSSNETDLSVSDSFRPSTGYHGLGITGVGSDKSQGNQPESVNTAQKAPSALAHLSKSDADEDDLYFDDGIIEHPSDGEDTHEFDESVFDNDDTDEYGRPLRPLSSLLTLYSPPYVKQDTTQTDQERPETGRGSRMSQELDDPNSAISPKSLDSLIFPQQAVDGSNGVIQPGHNLTQDSLSAYQSALAAAAYKAAASGRFRRDSIPAMQFDEREEQNGAINDLDHVASELSIHRPLSPDYEDDFDYDDALEDDPIIAEANAEALANDSEGFYGREFGFYSASASGESQFGGCFGPRGANGTLPSQNGRVVSREPNLTPITERSEYSNRNSIMSLPLSGVGHIVGSGSLSSPGLIHLAGMMNEYDEENMSLEALLKLRRGAWGGSQTSLPSSNGNGSPMSAAGEDASPVQQSPLIQSSSFGHSRDNSGHSLRLDHAVSEANSAPASPTLTMSIPSRPKTKSASASGLPTPPPALLHSLNSRPLSPGSSKPSSAVGIIANEPGDNENGSLAKPSRGRHHHSASAESISYMKEDDPVAGERWVLERWRTAETGEVEILGREVVSGGRI